jgi:SAM-dependent methyltransferase
MTDQYEPATYGERIAEVYDDIYPSFSDIDAMIETLAKLAGAGPVLELGIGTGRVALPLAARGVTVHGIDASQAMVKKLRTKPGGASIPIVIGDFADVDVTGQYSLIYVVFNTFFAITSQDDQVRCFANCASRLHTGGTLLRLLSGPYSLRPRPKRIGSSCRYRSRLFRCDASRSGPANGDEPTHPHHQQRSEHVSSSAALRLAKRAV